MIASITQMNAAAIWLVIGMGAFVGTHFLFSHPLRAGLVRRFGAGGFQVIYSLVALATFSWAVLVFGQAPSVPMLWDGQAVIPWLLATVLTYGVVALFLASVIGNPALAGAKISGLSTVLPSGVFRVTRHPMMFSFALWGVTHILIAPSPRTIILSGGIILLALLGSHFQDRKKKALYGQDWRVWMKRTPFWPDLTKLNELGQAWIWAFPVWLLLTWLHLPMAQVPAGVWRWLEQF